MSYPNNIQDFEIGQEVSRTAKPQAQTLSPPKAYLYQNSDSESALNFNPSAPNRIILASRSSTINMASSMSYQQPPSYATGPTFVAANAPSPNQPDTPHGVVQVQPQRHQRGYQACEQCRKRKVKCLLGDDPDNPTPPPCNRCKREHKQCTFAETRKKRKNSEDQDSINDGRQRASSSTSQSFPDVNNNPMLNTPHRRITSAGENKAGILTPNDNPYSNPTSFPSQFSNTSQSYSGPRPPMMPNMNGLNGVQLRSDVAADVLHNAAPTTHDNLSLLSQAANQMEHINRNSMSVRGSSSAFGAAPATTSTNHRRTFSNMHPDSIDTTLNIGMAAGNPEQNSSYVQAVKAWSSMRFVRAGWFTADEAMDYIEYYYEKMAPMTPVVTPEFRHPSRHLGLLTDEPILAITILTIASRHLSLSGPASTTRSYQIHDKLWNYLRSMVERLLWGQEQFGGGFCGGGTIKVRESKGGQLTWKGSLRTLGTIEALLLLTDWQPRALHFPPGDDENRLLDTDYNLLSDNSPPAIDEDHDDSHGPSGNESRPYGSWLEPAWRSDRMSWMLLGLAQSLSFELGVFDNNHHDCKNEHGPFSDCARKRKVRRLVLVYVSQTSGRLGIPSMLPLQHWGSDDVFDQTSKAQSHGETEDPVDIMQELWLSIATVMYKANQRIFATRQFTRELTASGKYRQKIAEFVPQLDAWKRDFEKVKDFLQPLMKHILLMEFEYARCYINSLGLQKVVESWVQISREAAQASVETTGGVDQSVLLNIYSPNKVYIDEVADAARTILTTVVEGLAPGGDLRNAPVRTYLRAISGLMFTLKRFGLGAFEQDVRHSLDLLNQTTELMATNVVDDVHLSSQTSGLVKLIVANIQKTFIRVQAPVNGSESASREQSLHPPSQPPDSQGDPYQPASKRPKTSSSIQGLPLRDPLAGIQAQPMEDLSNYTFMPPPNYYQNNQQMMDPNMQLDSTGSDPMFDPMNADWLTLRLDHLFSGTTGTVDQGFGGIGPTVGDRDMLELITNEQYDQWNVSNMNFGHG